MRRWYAGMCTQVGIAPGGVRDTIKAISLGESSGIADMFGDVHLEDAKWGPSIGLHQIRTLRADTDKATDRDIVRVLNPLENLRAAWAISKQGTDFTPWSVFNSGSYKSFMPGGSGYKADYIVDFNPWLEATRHREVLATMDQLKSGLILAMASLPGETVDRVRALSVTRTETLEWVAP